MSYVYVFAPDYTTAQWGTAAMPCRSGYDDMSITGPFRTETGPYAQLVLLRFPRLTATPTTGPGFDGGTIMEPGRCLHPLH
jgi:hypothetical protein